MTDPNESAKPEIRLYDTASRQKQVLRPLDPSNVRMYVCGPTVYDRAHIGNARPVVVFDVIYRLLRHVYGEGAVTYVRNITDVDDKINRRAAETRGEGESTLDAIRRITDETIGWYHDDMAALGALPPTHEPRATEHVAGMIEMIETLIGQGHAYEAEGHVLFHVPSWEGYGSLSRRPLDEMEAGARVEVAPYKRSPLDFVLWKPSDETLPGWDSPWGRGRPGWHIECSAMAKALLGERFDIHGGGIDLQFPHHENELAQSRCANDTEAMAQVWMHNGYLMVEGEKMSKSLGNFFTVKDLRQSLSGDVIRHVLLQAHYRSPLDWTQERVEEAKAILNRWIKLYARFRRENMKLPKKLQPDADVILALAEDLNTPEALRRTHELATDGDLDPKKLQAFVETASFLGFRPGTAVGPGASASVEDAAEALQKLNELRAQIDAAREKRDYERADKIREELRAAGVEVQITKSGAVLERTVDFDARKLAEMET